VRQTAIDHARERLAAKRGGDLVRTELEDDFVDAALDAQQTLALDQALRALEAQDARLAEVFCWRVFGGLDASEIAALRGVTLRTVNRDLALARAYLRHVLDGAA
jgi:DNA-directed RNA polymerase specialized sigma24 family protein